MWSAPCIDCSGLGHYPKQMSGNARNVCPEVQTSWIVFIFKELPLSLLLSKILLGSYKPPHLLISIHQMFIWISLITVIASRTQWEMQRYWEWIRLLQNWPKLVEKAMATHSSTLAWKIPWAEEPGGLRSMGSPRVPHDWATSLSLFTFMHWSRKWQPTPVFLPGESQGQRSLVGCRLWSRTESDTAEGTQQQQQCWLKQGEYLLLTSRSVVSSSEVV